MTLRQKLENIMQLLPVRHLDNEQMQSLRDLVEVDLVEEVIRCLGTVNNYKILGRTGQGRRADVPWIGIHDQRVDSDAQSGVYLTILFRVDGSGFAFSIQQGTDNYGINAIQRMVANLKSDLGLPDNRFTKGQIRMRPVPLNKAVFPNHSRPAKYEIANVIGIEFDSNDIPDTLENDLRLLFGVYQKWARDVINTSFREEGEYQSFDFPVGEAIIDITVPTVRRDRLNENYRAGSPYPPRDNRQGAVALVRAGYQCEVDPEHTTFVKENGNSYMEKHHLIPMERYFNFHLSVDHFTNIYSLCPMCHRKIHYGRAQDKRELVQQLYVKRMDDFQGLYRVGLDQMLSFYNAR